MFSHSTSPRQALRVAATFCLVAASAANAQEPLPGAAAPPAQPPTAQPPTGQPSADQPQGQQPTPDQIFAQQLSYALGMTIGRDLRRNGAPIDMRAFMTGMGDALTGTEPKMSPQQMGMVMQEFQRRIQQRAGETAIDNQKQGEAFLAANAKKDGVTTTASGLQYRVITPGTGPKPGPTDTVKCHYEGRLISGKVFDASRLHGDEPSEFPLNRVIRGWTEAVQLMPVGSKYELFVPGPLAYGPSGQPPAIGPNATLIFTIELLDIVQ